MNDIPVPLIAEMSAPKSNSEDEERGFIPMRVRKKLRKWLLKTYDFSSTPCKNFDLNQYECENESNKRQKKQCLKAFYSREAECKAL